MIPLAIDLYCGLGGWTSGLLAENYDVIGFDIERHQYGEHRYPAQLVIQDVLTLHGSQFRDAALIVASPPCQRYSWMAMPWSLAKAKAAEIRADTTGAMLTDLNALFDACFRLQKEACEEAGRHIPMVVENVRGAQPWVGRARYNFGSFYLWGDVPALMPIALGRAAMKVGVAHRPNGETNFHGHAKRAAEGYKSSGMNWSDPDRRGQDFTRIAGRQASEGIKQGGSGAAWFDDILNERRKAATAEGRKVADDWFGPYAEMKAAGTISPTRTTGKGSSARKAASAMIAKIPEPLSRHIARVYRP